MLLPICTFHLYCFAATVFAVDLGLYGYWGFRLDGSVLIYLSDPKEAMASLSWGETLRQVAILLLYGGAMMWSYLYVLRLFRNDPLPLFRRLPLRPSG